MQQDWKAIWDNLNPDEAAKERMKQAILQKIQAETPQTASKKPPFFLQRCSFGTFARAAALCCMTVTVALAGLHLTDPSRAEQPGRRFRKLLFKSIKRTEITIDRFGQFAAWHRFWSR